MGNGLLLNLPTIFTKTKLQKLKTTRLIQLQDNKQLGQLNLQLASFGLLTMNPASRLF